MQDNISCLFLFLFITKFFNSMKKLIFSVFVLLTFLYAKCEDDTPKNPIDLLPPATQIGANTFGCLVDGEPFTPDGRPLSFSSQYSFNSVGDRFSLSGGRRYEDRFLSIGMVITTPRIEKNVVYVLSNATDTSSFGEYYKYAEYQVEGFTSQEHKGEMTITRFEDNVISGTFWFDVKDTDGVVHQIREGRFDVKY